MQHKFSKLFRSAGAVVFGAVLMASIAAFTASEALAQQSATTGEEGTAANNGVQNQGKLPFAGFASLSPEERERKCENQTPDILLYSASKLSDAQMYDDARTLLKYLLGTDCPDDEYLPALEQYVAATADAPLEDAIKYADIEQALDEALAARPDSWRVKKSVADLLGRLPELGYMQDGKFVYAREERDDLLSCRARQRVRRLQLYAEALPLVREELERLDDPDAIASNDAPELIQSQAGLFYYDFTRCFKIENPSDYCRQLTLTDLSVLPDYVPAADDVEENFSEIPADEEGAPVFITASESFETAKNDGERRQALLNELTERIPLYYYKDKVRSERIQEAEALFSVKNLHPLYLSFFSNDADPEQEARQEEIWSLSALDDSETIAKLTSGVKRFKLPPEYDYINLRREKAKDLPYYFSELAPIAREYENRRQFNKAADLWKQLLEELVPHEWDEEEASAALSQIVAPRVVIDSSSVVSGLNTNLYLRFRNANGVEIVVKRLNLDELLKTLHTQEFWQERGNFIGDLSGGKMNVIFDQILFKQFVPERKSGYIKRADRKFSDWLDAFELIGDEVARYSVALEPDPNHYDKITRVDFPVGEPGAYLVEIAATGGNKDAAIVWLHDFVVAHERLEKGVRCLALDAITGEPLAEQALEFFVFNRDAKDDVPAIKEYAKQTDETGALFFSDAEYPNDDAAVVLVTVPKDGVEKTSAAQTAFIGSQGIWRLCGLPHRKNSGEFYLDNSQAFFLADRDVYRPNEKAEFKFIVGGSDYDSPENSMWAGQEVDFQIVSPSGEIVVTKSVTLDKHGAFCESFEIPGDAKPGDYSVQLGLFKDQKDPYLRTSVYFTPGRGLLGIGSIQIAE